MSLGHVYVRVGVGVGRKRGVLQTSNRERVPKVLMSIRPAMRKPMPLNGVRYCKCIMERQRGCSRVPVCGKPLTALSRCSLGEAQKAMLYQGIVCLKS